MGDTLNSAQLAILTDPLQNSLLWRVSFLVNDGGFLRQIDAFQIADFFVDLRGVHSAYLHTIKNAPKPERSSIACSAEHHTLRHFDTPNTDASSVNSSLLFRPRLRDSHPIQPRRMQTVETALSCDQNLPRWDLMLRTK